MKFLIWFVTYMVMFMLNELLGLLVGFKLGYLLFLPLGGFVSNSLCRVLDRHKFKKLCKKLSAEATAQGMRVEDYICKDIPSSCTGMCEHLRGNTVKLKSFLKKCVGNKTISKDAYIYLLEVYRKNKEESY